MSPETMAKEVARLRRLLAQSERAWDDAPAPKVETKGHKGRSVFIPPTPRGQGRRKVWGAT